jgi:hypothetical protein
VSKSYKKIFDDYKEKMFLILTTKWLWYQPSEQAVCFFLPDLLKIHLHNDWILYFCVFVFHFTENSTWDWDGTAVISWNCDIPYMVSYCIDKT